MAILGHNTNLPDTAGGYYVVFWYETGTAWKTSTSALAAYTTTRDDFDVQASGGTTTGRYIVTVPALPVGYYFWSWFKEASVGTRSHANDTQVATGDGYWNGVAFTQLMPEFYTSNSLVSQTVVSFGIGPTKDSALLGYVVRISSLTAGEASGFASCLRRVTAHSWAADVSSVTLDSAPIFTLAGGEYLEFYPYASGIEDLIDDIADVTSAGPIEHTLVPKSRILPVKTRGDGTIGVVGQVRIQPSETLWYAVELAGSQLAPGDFINSMSAPSISGEDSANLTTPSYGVLGTLAKFKCVAASTADSTDTLYINLVLSPETGESLKIQVPVTVLEAS